MIEAILAEAIGSLLSDAGRGPALRAYARLANALTTRHPAKAIDIRPILDGIETTSSTIHNDLTEFIEGRPFTTICSNATVILLASRSPDYASSLFDQININLRMSLDEDADTCAQIGYALHRQINEASEAIISKLAEEERDTLSKLVSEARQERATQALESLARSSRLANAKGALSMDRLIGLNVQFLRQVEYYTSRVLLPHPVMKRRVLLDSVYVPPDLRTPVHTIQVVDGTDLLDVLADLHRIVVLGDPGAGKSTLGQKVCMDVARRALDGDGRHGATPIMLRLRDYGAMRRKRNVSFVDVMAEMARSDYQMPEDARILAEYFMFLLTNGRAVVIFDGLDELLDPAFRSTIVSDVEQFANVYSDVPMLVTSRRVGYQWAPLDRSRFKKAELTPFSATKVTAYAKKWFEAAEDEGESNADEVADRFLVESTLAEELRTNPLLLALLCSVYKGREYIPRNRPEIYEACATLLFDTWDRDRDLRPHLEIEHHVVPLLSHLAWWMFSDDNVSHGVTESDMIAKAAAYLHKERFDHYAAAEAAATAFVRYCRDRLWVLTEVGSAWDTPLYAFTHRTFLEYFASENLVYTYDDLSDFADVVIRLATAGGGSIVPELATQILQRRTRRAHTVLEVALSYVDWRGTKAAVYAGVSLLTFVARCLEFIVPPPALTRKTAELVVLHAKQHALLPERRRIDARLSLRSADFGRTWRISSEPMQQESAMADALCRFVGSSSENWHALADGLYESISSTLADQNYADIDMLAIFDIATGLVPCSLLSKFEEGEATIRMLEHYQIIADSEGSQPEPSQGWPTRLWGDFDLWLRWNARALSLVSDKFRVWAQRDVALASRGVVLGIVSPQDLFDRFGVPAAAATYWSYCFGGWLHSPLLLSLLSLVANQGTRDEGHFFRALGRAVQQPDFWALTADRSRGRYKCQSLDVMEFVTYAERVYCADVEPTERTSPSDIGSLAGDARLGVLVAVALLCESGEIWERQQYLEEAIEDLFPAWVASLSLPLLRARRSRMAFDAGTLASPLGMDEGTAVLKDWAGGHSFMRGLWQ